MTTLFLRHYFPYTTCRKKGFDYVVFCLSGVYIYSLEFFLAFVVAKGVLYVLRGEGEGEGV